MVIVDDRVAVALRTLGEVDVGVFVASCAERMAQLFTGLGGEDQGRSVDVDVVLQILDELWDFELSGDRFAGSVESLARFPELLPGDDEIVDTGEIFSFYGVLVVRYACVFRSVGDSEDAIQCAHVALTAMGQIDQNVAGSALFEEENSRQLKIVDDLHGGQLGSDRYSKLRAEDQELSRGRLVVVRDRLGV
jgi:hypothetical protein